MTGPGREERALAQLLRVARQKLEEQQTRLADLGAAMRSAETSLDWLAQAVRAEETAAAGRPHATVDLMNYLAAAGAKRAALEATRERLARESGIVREMVRDAFAEISKLEHLVAINRRAAARQAGKAEETRLDAAAVARGRRSA